MKTSIKKVVITTEKKENKDTIDLKLLCQFFDSIIEYPNIRHHIIIDNQGEEYDYIYFLANLRVTKYM